MYIIILDFAIHKWYAILLDAKSNLDGIKERITQLENVKKHMIRAIELNPEDSTSRYILGNILLRLKIFLNLFLLYSR